MHVNTLGAEIKSNHYFRGVMQVCGVAKSEMPMRGKEGVESKSDTTTVRISTTIDYFESKQQFK